MDRPMKRPHMGLIYVMMCPRCGWCGWHFNHDGFGVEWDATMLLRGLLRPTPVVEIDILYLMILLKPICTSFTYICIMI